MARTMALSDKRDRAVDLTCLFCSPLSLPLQLAKVIEAVDLRLVANFARILVTLLKFQRTSSERFHFSKSTDRRRPNGRAEAITHASYGSRGAKQDFGACSERWAARPHVILIFYMRLSLSLRFLKKQITKLLLSVIQV